MTVAKNNGIWCNGNTTDSGPVIPGSSPGIPTTSKSKLIFSTWIFCFIPLPYYNRRQKGKQLANKGKQLKQQVQYITTQMLLKGKQQITTQQDRKAAPTLLSFF